MNLLRPSGFIPIVSWSAIGLAKARAWPPFAEIPSKADGSGKGRRPFLETMFDDFVRRAIFDKARGLLQAL